MLHSVMCKYWLQGMIRLPAAWRIIAHSLAETPGQLSCRRKSMPTSSGCVFPMHAGARLTSQLCTFRYPKQLLHMLLQCSHASPHDDIILPFGRSQ